MIDTHCHLFDAPLDQQWKQLLQNNNTGLSGVAVMATTEATWVFEDKYKSEVSEMLKYVFYAKGIHPWFVHEAEKGWENRLESEMESADAVGEIGLDKGNRAPDINLQLTPFALQMEIAEQKGKPVCIHAVKSHDLIMEFLKEHPDIRGIMHAFSGSPSVASFYVERGWKLGFGGGVLRENAHRLRRILGKIPTEAIVLETDSPYMGVGDTPPGQSTPLQTLDVARAISEIKKVSFDELIEITNKNALEIFNSK